jgi:DNA-binding PadR family transcriptional regulator
VLKFIILGLLFYKSRTGYDISKTMSSSTEFFWHASQSQIYPTLQKMHAEGLVNSQQVWEKNKAAKIIYSITAKGKKELLGWLTKNPVTHEMKDEFFIQLFFLNNLVGDQEVLKKIQSEIDYHEGKLGRYMLYKKKYLEREIDRKNRGRHLTLMYGIETEKMAIKFFQQAKKAYEIEKPQAGTKKSRIKS